MSYICIRKLFKMILAQTIQKRLEKETNRNICYEFDIRNLGKWIEKYPQCFPKYIIEKNYTPYFNPSKYRWELLKGIKEIKFNKENYI